ncbi:MAG TPA: hypothetical protein VIM94_11740, partial [Salegentibacter sp.]|uniref:hypothetical protein n=1 Tax=Salegentibacter sp. TaxID=1903072 RepID=UPI002F929299
FLLSFFARPKNETKKGAICAGVFLATRPKNRASAPKFSPGLRKFSTVPRRYTHKRVLKSQDSQYILIIPLYKH